MGINDLSATQSSSTTSPVVHEHVFEKVREAIISGQFSPGDAISVRKLASQYGVSAMPAREAIRRLVAMGALEMTETRRITLASMSQKKLSEIRRGRLALEPMLAIEALKQVQTNAKNKRLLIEKLTRLDDELDLAIESGDASAYARKNSEFHFLLYRASESDVILGLVESLWLQFGPIMRVIIGRSGTAWFEDDKHKKAVDAIRDGDPKTLGLAITEDITDGLDKVDELFSDDD